MSRKIGAGAIIFEIRNKTLKELCKRVDELQPKDQNIICHFLDMAVRQDKLRQIVANPISPQRASKGGR